MRALRWTDPRTTSTAYHRKRPLHLAGLLLLVMIGLTFPAQSHAAEGPPRALTLPTIEGDPMEGGLLEADPGTWDGTTPIDFSFQWLRCEEFEGLETCDPIEGATEARYVPAVPDVEHILNVQVTGTNSLGRADAHADVGPYVEARPPSTEEPAVISGSTADGERLSVTSEGWTGTAPIEYHAQWRRCAEEEAWNCTDIATGGGDDYILQSADVGSYVTAIVHGRNRGGQESARANVVGPITAVAPSSTSRPQIYGSIQLGETIAANYGAWRGTAPLEYAVQWQRCDSRGESCADIEGSTELAYDVTSEDVGRTLRARVTASNGLGSASAYSSAEATSAEGLPRATDIPFVTGTMRVGRTATANNGEWDGREPISYSRQWLRCDTVGESCVPIPGETSATYDIYEADYHRTLAIVVTATNEVGRATEQSQVSAPMRGAAATTARFAYVRQRTEIWTASLDSGREPKLVTSMPYDNPIWETALSPEGEMIAFLTCNGVWVVNVDGSDKRRLVDTPCEPIISLLAEPEFAFIFTLEGIGFTPEGESLIFSAAENYWEGTGGISRDLYTVDISSSELEQIPVDWEEPSWSPDEVLLPSFSSDGDRLAYVAAETEGGGNLAVVLATPNGDPLKLIDMSGVADYDPETSSPPRFSPEGTSLVLTAQTDDESEVAPCTTAVYVIDIASETVRPVIDADDCELGIAWYNPTWTNDGRHILVGTFEAFASPSPRITERVDLLDPADGSDALVLDGEGRTIASPATPTASAPRVSFPGADDGTFYSDGSGDVTIPVLAQDQALGIETIAFGMSYGSADDAWSATCEPACPTDADHDFEIDPTELAEGAHPYVAWAVNSAGATGRQTFTLIVDRTEPVPAADPYVGAYDAETRLATIRWSLAEDPKPEEEAVSSGIASEEFRWRVEGGAWSEWEDASAASVQIPAIRANERLEFEARATDRAGNTYTAEAVEVDWTPTEADPEAEVEGIDFGSEGSLLRGGRRCSVEFAYGGKPLQTNGKGEPNAVIDGKAIASCPIPPPGVKQNVRLTVCVRMYGGSGPDFHPQHCETRHDRITVTTMARIACRAGDQEYDISAAVHIEQPFPIGDREARGATDSRTYHCNNAGAWRYSAKMDSSKPSTTLGDRMISDGDRPPSSIVASPRNGFDAHHIIPWNMRRKWAAAVQSLAWTCGLGLVGNEPTVNETANGSWLRGSRLARAGEGKATKDTPGYRSLRPEAKRRAYHPTIHTDRYFQWIAGELLASIEDEGCDPDLAATALAEIKRGLEEGSYVR